MKGISLIELLVYLSVSTILLNLALLASLTVQKTCRMQIAHAEQWVQLGIALERIIDDVHQTKPSDWVIKENNRMVFLLANTHCGWALDKKRLVRVTGFYDKGAHEWSSRAMSVILDAVESFSLEYIYVQRKLVGVKIAIALTKNCSCQSCVACKRGVED